MRLSPCRECGRSFESTRVNGAGQVQRTCSRTCGSKERARRKANRLQALAIEAETRRSGTCDQCATAYRKASPTQRYCSPQCYRDATTTPRTHTCAHCGEQLVAKRKRLHPECAKARKKAAKKARRKVIRAKVREDRKHTSRAKRFGVPRDFSIWNVDVYARDGWTCQLCHGPISKRLLGRNEPQAPSVDHIIPLSMLGSPGHVWSNVQAAHRACNTAKRNRPKGQGRLDLGVCASVSSGGDIATSEGRAA
jgi:5-methylcytosine-specific restriction endonuclease McrA